MKPKLLAESFARGASYLGKPFTPTALLEKIAHVKKNRALNGSGVAAPPGGRQTR